MTCRSIHVHRVHGLSPENDFANFTFYRFSLRICINVVLRWKMNAFKRINKHPRVKPIFFKTGCKSNRRIQFASIEIHIVIQLVCFLLVDASFRESIDFSATTLFERRRDRLQLFFFRIDPISCPNRDDRVCLFAANGTTSSIIAIPRVIVARMTDRVRRLGPIIARL